MYYKAKVNFKKMGVEMLDQVAENVLTKMTGNGLFPNPVPELSVLDTDLSDYRVAVVEAVRGGKHATTVRDRVRGRLENTLHSLAFSVQQVAMGDPAVILAAGFDHNKAREPKGRCPQPADFVAISGPLGSRSITLKVKPHRTARSYRFAYRIADGETPWIEVSSHGSRRTVAGLQQFSEYEFRCAYIGNDPEVLNYSDSVMATVI
ncbi:fibronectin type III domain-containing protein [Parapedobacter tibetensis]|uniref:fibronectin type III domain-containing protein n=1 Tax=Parapedobacter tibetensis TaxID=2972951 RepID=UPI00214DA236|nr:fibronectin type III domain-containing protein [Parapedobacter tibetensis]